MAIIYITEHIKANALVWWSRHHTGQCWQARMVFTWDISSFPKSSQYLLWNCEKSEGGRLGVWVARPRCFHSKHLSSRTWLTGLTDWLTDWPARSRSGAAASDSVMKARSVSQSHRNNRAGLTYHGLVVHCSLLV